MFMKKSVFYNFLLVFFFSLSIWQSYMVFNFDDSLYYPIPTYNGSREMEFWARNSILYGNSSSFSWSTLMDVDENNSLWLPDPKTNTIKRITPEGKVIIIAGKSLKSGFRNGDLKNTLFNNCFNLAYYNPSFFLQVKENNSVTIILKNNSSPCLYVNKTNYTICQDNNTNNSIINDTDLIKKIYLKTDEEITNLTIEYINNISNLTDLITSRVLFVVDKNNHCIRLIDIEKRISKTYAGICTIAGFQDGRLGTNLFKYPESLGVDIFGNVFVYDSGNQYIRMIKKNGCVLTLVPGACRRDFRYVSQNLPKFGLKNEVVTCYREWMNSTAGDNVCSESQSNFCYDEIFLCPNDQSPFIYNNSNT